MGKPATPLGKRLLPSERRAPLLQLLTHTQGSSSSPPSGEIEIIEELCQGSSQASSLPDSVSPLSTTSLGTATQTKRSMLGPQAQVPRGLRPCHGVPRGASAPNTKPLILVSQKRLSPVTTDCSSGCLQPCVASSRPGLSGTSMNASSLLACSS